MFAGSTILYKMLVCLSESRGGSSYGESIFSYCGQRYLVQPLLCHKVLNWSTQSNAFFRSRKTTPFRYPLFIFKYHSYHFYGYIIRIIKLAPAPTLNFDFGFFWPDLATFYVSFGSFGLRPAGMCSIIWSDMQKRSNVLKECYRGVGESRNPKKPIQLCRRRKFNGNS
jgi:hypothetical protein